MGNSCGKFLWEILVGNSWGKSQFKKDSDWWKFSIWNRVMGSQPISIQLRKILREIVAGKSCGKLLRENLAGNSCGKFLRKFLWENLAGNSCGKILREILAGNSCGKWRRGKSQFKKDSDWWKFSIWNRVMGSQPISIQLRKILRENLAGNCCGKILWEILAGNCCGKILRKFLREILAGNSCGKWRRGKSQFKKDSDWWKFSIWNRVMGSQPISIQLRKILRENLGKFLWENLVGNSCGKFLWEMEEGKKPI